MKKNISINISGIIFHIEEDAFDKLKEYLDGINKYFSSFNDSQEIISDIESRIAEIFLAKLNDEKQVITLEDVESLTATMGSIRDFQTVEEDFSEDNREENSTQNERTFDQSYSKKLFRDGQRKLLGGVCAGIAHYFNIDPLWIRLIFFLLLIGSGGIILPIYIVMWIILPVDFNMPEDKKLKKMFRDNDSKVIAGVCTGMANYFGIDVVIVRLIFVLTLFMGGFGLLSYILLWLILPEAKSVSDKIQMKGEPVTLSNIESNIKQGLNVKENEEENVFVKILLFPFRVIALVIETIGKFLGPFAKFLVEAIRIFIGAILILIGATTIISLVIAVGIIIGIFSTDLADVSLFHLGDIGVPLDAMTNGIPAWTITAAVVASIIPFFFLILLGSSIVAKRVTFSSNAGWTLFAAFVISVIVLGVNVPLIAFNFSEEGDRREVITYDLKDKTAVIKLNENGNREYNMVSLKIRGHAGNEYRLEEVFESQGKTRTDAEENTKMITYNVTQEDSVLYFDSNVKFNRDAIFRAQRLSMTLYVPYGAKFKMDRDLRYILENTIYRHGYKVSDMGENTWTYTKKGLECLTCGNRYNHDIDIDMNAEDYSSNEDNPNGPVSNISEDSYDKQISFRDFENVEIEGAYTVYFEHSDQYQVLIDGPDRLVDDLIVDQEGRDLLISIEDFDDHFNFPFDREEVKILIKTPYLREIVITGASDCYISNFNLKDLSIELLGASSLKADMQVEDLDIELTGASRLELRGKGDYLNAAVVGASELNAYEYKVRNAKLDADGVSSIKAFVTDNISMEESFISKIKYKGGATVNGRSRKNE